MTEGERIAILERDLAALDRLLSSHRVGHEREHELLMQAVEEFKSYLKSKLIEMNEVRAQIGEERGAYITRDALDARMAGIESHISALSQSMDSRLKAIETKVANYDGRLWMIGAVMTALMFIITIVTEIVIRMIWKG